MLSTIYYPINFYYPKVSLWMIDIKLSLAGSDYPWTIQPALFIGGHQRALMRQRNALCGSLYILSIKSTTLPLFRPSHVVVDSLFADF